MQQEQVGEAKFPLLLALLKNDTIKSCFFNLTACERGNRFS